MPLQQEEFLLSAIFNHYVNQSTLKRGILVLQGPRTDKNSAMFYYPLWKKIESICDKNCISKVVDNWDASNVKKIITDLTEDFKNNLGFVAAANDDIGLEFYKQFTTHKDYYMASHDNVKEKVDSLYEGLQDKFMTVDMEQVKSVHQTIEVIKELVENKPISFTSIDTFYSISQPQILHKVKMLTCKNRTNIQ